MLTGGDGLAGFSDGLGIRINSSVVRMRSGSIRSGNGIGATRFPPSWIVGGQLLVDPSVTLIGPSFPFGAQPQVTPLSELTSTSATAPGTAMTATVSAPNGTLVALFAGQPIAPAQLLALPVATWLDPTHAVLEAMGIAQLGGNITGDLAVPNQPSLRGATIAWQALTLRGASLANTNPALAAVL
ncbi:MAG: hypothetical protein AB8H80_22690 [Planctomycetota bacterium]